jgi:hypothetical protein
VGGWRVRRGGGERPFSPARRHQSRVIYGPIKRGGHSRGRLKIKAHSRRTRGQKGGTASTLRMIMQVRSAFIAARRYVRDALPCKLPDSRPIRGAFPFARTSPCRWESDSPGRAGRAGPRGQDMNGDVPRAISLNVI